jgi:hypothetical protein
VKEFEGWLGLAASELLHLPSKPAGVGERREEASVF